MTWMMASMSYHQASLGSLSAAPPAVRAAWPFPEQQHFRLLRPARIHDQVSPALQQQRLDMHLCGEKCLGSMPSQAFKCMQIPEQVCPSLICRRRRSRLYPLMLTLQLSELNRSGLHMRCLCRCKYEHDGSSHCLRELTCSCSWHCSDRVPILSPAFMARLP